MPPCDVESSALTITNNTFASIHPINPVSLHHHRTWLCVSHYEHTNPSTHIGFICLFAVGMSDTISRRFYSRNSPMKHLIKYVCVCLNKYSSRFRIISYICVPQATYKINFRHMHYICIPFDQIDFSVNTLSIDNCCWSKFCPITKKCSCCTINSFICVWFLVTTNIIITHTYSWMWKILAND